MTARSHNAPNGQIFDLSNARNHVCSDVLRARAVTMGCPGDDEPGLTGEHINQPLVCPHPRLASAPDRRATAARKGMWRVLLATCVLATDCGVMHLTPCVKGLSSAAPPRKRRFGSGVQAAAGRHDPAPKPSSP